MKFYVFSFSENLSRKFNSHKHLIRITGSLHETHYIFVIMSRLVILRVRNVLEKSCREYQNTQCSITLFFEVCAVYEIMWKNIIERGRPQTSLWHMACWIPKATDTYSEYVILITFPLQQRLHERASMLRYTNNASLV